MIKVAVVDDEKKECDKMLNYFEQFQMEISEEIQTVCYTSGEKLLSIYDYSFDVICLDIELGGKDGICIAKEIREKDKNVTIIFITNIAQMAIKGYEVQALDFVLKPLTYFSFAMKMHNVYNIVKNKKEKNLVISTIDGIYKISTNDLMYAEIRGHSLFFHTINGVVTQKASLSDLERKLEGLSFQRCNNCYLINLKYVSQVKKDDVLVGSQWLKISRPRKKLFLQALANYMRGIRI